MTFFDVVHFDGQKLQAEKLAYVLLNKPKGFITTTRDEKARRTVMELVANASKERIYPVGRLDRNTTGLLLFTNDGEMAKKLTHPKHNVRKLYHATLDNKLALKDLEKLKFVIETIEEPTLNDLPRSPSSIEGVIVKNGVELPPTNTNGKVKEKEEI